MFVYEPALLMIGDWSTIAWRFGASVLGILLLAAGLHGFLLRPAVAWERLVLIGAAVCLVKPGWQTDLLGFALFATVAFAQRWSLGRGADTAERPPRAAA